MRKKKGPYKYLLIAVLLAIVVGVATRGLPRKKASSHAAGRAPVAGQAAGDALPASTGPAAPVAGPTAASEPVAALTRETLQKLEVERQKFIKPELQAGELDETNAELRRALVLQIDEARKQLAASKARLGADGEARSLDVAAKLLESTRERLLSPQPEGAEGVVALGDQIATVLDTAQQQLDELKAMAAQSPDGFALMQQIDQKQKQLDMARATLAAANPAPGVAADPGAQVEEMLERSRQSLAQARLRAAGMPNAAELFQQIDAAERQLDQAEASYRSSQEGAQKGAGL